ncbi:hypothetical protein [Actinoplanes philippinensis]|uniref:hypothetical protein n=1 Tax=Actinoplanes philippinensis TaxID=35752 RepID=UPI0033F6648A
MQTVTNAVGGDPRAFIASAMIDQSLWCGTFTRSGEAATCGRGWHGASTIRPALPALAESAPQT